MNIKLCRRGFAALLALVLLLGAAPPAKAADSGFVIDHGVLVAYTGTAAKVAVPQGVRIIGREAFAWNQTMTEVVLPDSVTEIEGSAFMSCEALKRVTFSQKLITIGDYAFGSCPALKNVVLPWGLKAIGIEAFGALESISIPTSVTSIGAGGVPASLCTRQGDFYVAGDGILMGAAVAIPNLVVPPNIKSINAQAFAKNQWLGDYLVTLVIPGTVKTIGDDAFRYCQKLTSVTLGEGVERLGNGVFDACSSLVEMTIPTTVRQIGRNAFGSPKTGQESGVNLSGGYIPWLEAQKQEFVIAGDGVLIQYNGSSEAIVVPDGVKAIGGGVFSHGSDSMMPESWRKPVPVSVTLPESITSIGPSAFQSCHRIEKIQLPAGLKEIGSLAFLGCNTLREIAIPEGVSVIGPDAFALCGSLTQVSLPSTITELGERAFSNCTALEYLQLPAGLKRIGHYALHNCRIQVLTLPEGVEYVAAQALDGRSGATLTVLGKNTRFDESAIDLGIQMPDSPPIPEEKRFLVYAPQGALVWGPVTRRGIRIQPLPVATPNTAKILVDGREIPFDAYLIAQNSYVKLRDLAAAFSESGRKFNVVWQPQTGAVRLYPGMPYEFVGGELKPGDGQSKPAIPGTGLIYADFLSGALKSYVVGGNNYVQLRNLAQYLNFRLDWDPAEHMIIIDTSLNYQA